MASRARASGIRPAPRPLVVGIEVRGAHPVVERQLVAVPDAAAPLLGAVHHEEPAERLGREAAELLRLAAIQQQDVAVAVEQLERRDETGNPRAHDDDVV